MSKLPLKKNPTNKRKRTAKKTAKLPRRAELTTPVGTLPAEPKPELVENNVLFLIGAGCSAPAGVKMVNQMMDEIENLVRNEKDWQPFEKLYYYLKSAILYSTGITGDFKTPVNVEKLVVVLTELGKREQNIAYPFIGNWNTRLTDVAGEDFKNIAALQELIKGKLYEWINMGDYSKAEYYSGLGEFQRELGYPVRVFSFNYDLCVEEAIKDVTIELGFDPKTSQWGYFNFEPNEAKDIGIFLYKLHGSIDWERLPNKGNVLVKRKHPAQKSELIFGTDAKLTSTDPYLYYVFEFRKYTLQEDCKLIVVIGYSFGDDYMNKLIEQALAATASRNLLIVDLDPERLKNILISNYSVKPDQVKTLKASSEVFLREQLSLSLIAQNLPTSEGVPF